jgi:hypothetical protein
MTKRHGWAAIAFFLLILTGCSSSPTYLETVFPEKIGQFNRSTVSQNSGSWATAEYSKPGAIVFYGLGRESTAEEAQKRVRNKNFCDSKNLSDPDELKILKEEILKDKAGKEIGNILICREVVKDPYKNMAKGYKFKITTAHEQNYLLLEVRTGGLAELVEFAQALPLNSEVDFTGLKLNELIADNPSIATSPEDLIKLAPPLKLAEKPYLKGKIMMVEQVPNPFTHGEPTPSMVKVFDLYGLTKEMMSESLKQAGTVIQIVCRKGKKIGDYVTKDAEKKKFPAYDLNCTVSVIDQTIPAIIAQKNFVGGFNELLDKEKTFTLSEQEAIAYPPIEMYDFIKKLPKK